MSYYKAHKNIIYMLWMIHFQSIFGLDCWRFWDSERVLLGTVSERGTLSCSVQCKNFKDHLRRIYLFFHVDMEKLWYIYRVCYVKSWLSTYLIIINSINCRASDPNTSCKGSWGSLQPIIQTLNLSKEVKTKGCLKGSWK